MLSPCCSFICSIAIANIAFHANSTFDKIFKFVYHNGVQLLVHLIFMLAYRNCLVLRLAKCPKTTGRRFRTRIHSIAFHEPKRIWTVKAITDGSLIFDDLVMSILSYLIVKCDSICFSFSSHDCHSSTCHKFVHFGVNIFPGYHPSPPMRIPEQRHLTWNNFNWLMPIFAL